MTDAGELARLCRALGDETRVRIIALLANGELCVCHLEAALELPQPTVSRHLGVLRAAGVVEGRREGTWMYYALRSQEHAPIQRVLAAVTAPFTEERTLRADHARLRKSCGPGACK